MTEVTKLIQNVADIKLEDQRKEQSPSPARDNIIKQIPTRHRNIDELIKGLGHKGQKIHPSFIRAGLKMNHGVIRGSEPRCVAMLAAVKDFIRDYVTPSRKELTRDLISKLKINIKFLGECRPLSVGMATAFEFIQLTATTIEPNKSDAEAKDILLRSIEEYEYNQINMAMKGLAENTVAKLGDNECIMIYGCSLKVLHILYEAHSKKKQFKVIVVDSGPEYRGVRAVELLMKLNIEVTYTYINAIPFILSKVTKVILGGHAVLANGYVMSQTGSSQLALLASTHNVPVFLCCQTSEFTDAVYTDAYLYNEARLMSDFYAVKNERLREYFSSADKPPNANLEIAHLISDVTPPEFISVVITEDGVLPVSSVAAVMHAKSGIDKAAKKALESSG